MITQAHDTYIPTDFPFKPNYAEVFGAKLHYIQEGQGDPVLFLHGVPTWSYIWRNIIPYLSDQTRCIAPDLIGMGKSDKPDIEYRIFDHIRYVEEFIKRLKLKNITLVLHGWGSVIGFDYAMRHQENIKGIAFIEAYLRPVSDWSMVSLPIQEMSSILNTPDRGYDVIMNSNYFVNKVLPHAVMRTLSENEMENYRAPFAAPGSCKPLWQYLQDLPLGEGPSDVEQLIAQYSQSLQLSQIPKLMLYSVPGFNTTISTVQWAKEHLPNLTIFDIGNDLHCPQETNPTNIGHELRKWYEEI